MHPRDYVCYSNNPVKTQHTLLQQPLQHALPVPLVFQPNAGQSDAIQLRRGKWTADEEAYAEFLIKEFERGMVEGCENGCTLRSFLSKKLHCAPMRISKKFAGTFCALICADGFGFNLNILSMLYDRKIYRKTRLFVQGAWPFITSPYCRGLQQGEA